MQLTTKKKNTKVAEMCARVNDLQSELQAAQMGSAGLQSQVSDLEKQLEEQKEASRKIEEAAKKNAEETEKVRQKTLEMQGFLRTLFAEKFASGLLPDLQQ
jgi:predicted  nucleic acid-binding Zn-ribbon protein